MKKMFFALIVAAVAAISLAAVPAQASILGGGGAPYNAPPQIGFSALNSGSSYILRSVRATNMRQGNDRTAIVLGSATPAVCTVAPNSYSVGTYQDTPYVPVTIHSKGTCTITADQAASAQYVAGHAERSYLIR